MTNQAESPPVAPCPAKRSRLRWIVPLGLATILLALGYIYFYLYHPEGSGPAGTV